MSEDAGLHLVFVYGTLKRGHSRHHYLAEQSYVGEATTAPMYRLFNCGDYPGLVKVGTCGRAVKGEVYQVDTDCLTRLDEVECIAEQLYRRERIRLVDLFEYEYVLGYIYLPSTAGLPDCGTAWPARG